MRRKWKIAVPAYLYFCWSCLVYLGTLGGEGHSWWPVWLMPISILVKFTEAYWLVPLVGRFAEHGSDNFYLLYDRTWGFTCIVGGTLIVWLLSWGFLWLFRRYFGQS